ncbi:hypothetical protein GCM10027447_38590 [Glycomyces halotolerans]
MKIGRPLWTMPAAVGLTASIAAGCGQGADGSDDPNVPTASETATELAVPEKYCETLAAELLPDGADPAEYRIDGSWGTGSTRSQGDPYVCDVEPRDVYGAAAAGRDAVEWTLSVKLIGPDSPERDEYPEIPDPLDADERDWAEFRDDSELVSGTMECEAPTGCDGAEPVEVRMHDSVFLGFHGDLAFSAETRYYSTADPDEAEQAGERYSAELFADFAVAADRDL